MKKANPPRHQLPATSSRRSRAARRRTAGGAVFLLTFSFLLSAALHAAPPKEALLIANGKYSHFAGLAHPLSDAAKLGAALEQLGFRVHVVRDGNREQMLDAISEFERGLRNTGAIAFFHYGGHGVQVDGKNYLLPADADIPDERRVATRAVALDEVMTAMDAAAARASIIVIDACRDNPLPAGSGRNLARGLSVVGMKPKNSIVIYAAEAGSKALDGLFTPILAVALQQKGRTIDQVMKSVRSEVYAKSSGQQTPGEYNQLFEDLFLCLEQDQQNLKNNLPINQIEQQKIFQENAEIRSELATQTAATISDAIGAGNLDLASSSLARFSQIAPSDPRIHQLRALLDEASRNKEEQQKGANLMPLDLPEKGFFTLPELFKGSSYAGYNSHSLKIILQKVQDSLRQRSFYSTSGDGSPGPKTQQAIIAFQRSIRSAVTGRLDSETLDALELKKYAEAPEPTPNSKITAIQNHSSREEKSALPYGVRVPSKPNLVTSPHAPFAGYVDISGFSRGAKIKCPYAGKHFLVP